MKRRKLMQRHAYFQYAIRQYIVESIMNLIISKQSQHVIQSPKVIIHFHKERFTMTIHVMVIQPSARMRSEGYSIVVLCVCVARAHACVHRLYNMQDKAGHYTHVDYI